MKLPNWEWGCFGAMAVAALFWAAIIWLIFHPPGPDSIPWFLSGALIVIILGIYRRRKTP